MPRNTPPPKYCRPRSLSLHTSQSSERNPEAKKTWTLPEEGRVIPGPESLSWYVMKRRHPRKSPAPASVVRPAAGKVKLENPCAEGQRCLRRVRPPTLGKKNQAVWPPPVLGLRERFLSQDTGLNAHRLPLQKPTAYVRDEVIRWLAFQLMFVVVKWFSCTILFILGVLQ